MKKFLFILLFLTSISREVAASEYGFIEEPLVGFQNLSNLIIGDAFVPLSFFKAKSTQVKLSYIDYSVETLIHYDGGTGSHIAGDNLKGSAQSLFLSHEFSDKVALFAVFTTAKLTGKANYSSVNGDPTYSGVFDISTSSINAQMVSVAYDLVDKSATKKFSFPIYFAVQQRSQDIYFTYSDSSGDTFTLKDDKSYTSFFVGASVSWKPFSYLHVTPYILSGINNATSVSVTSPTQNIAYEQEIDEGAIINGLELTYTGIKNFVYSFSLDGVWNEVNPITKSIVHGLTMESVGVSVGYIF